jgi:hypothetical protein
MSDYAYTKLFSNIIHSSVWCEPLPTKIVWVTMLALADQFGRVTVALPGLAKAAGVSIAEAQDALDCFLAPDPYSRTPDHEGRRIEKINKGWRLLNYATYREQQDEEYQRARKAKNKADQRARERAATATESPVMSPPVTVCHPIAEAEAEAKKLAAAAADAEFHSGSSVPKKEVGENPPTCSAPGSFSEFEKSFGEPEVETYVPSARVQQLADVLGQHLKVAQDLDFDWAVISRVETIDSAPDKEVIDAMEYVLTRDAKRYWLNQMLSENEGRGSLKVFIRGYSTIKVQAKSRGKTRAAKPVANRAAFLAQQKGQSVVPSAAKPFQYKGEQL